MARVDRKRNRSVLGAWLRTLWHVFPALITLVLYHKTSLDRRAVFWILLPPTLLFSVVEALRLNSPAFRRAFFDPLFGTYACTHATPPRRHTSLSARARHTTPLQCTVRSGRHGTAWIGAVLPNPARRLAAPRRTWRRAHAHTHPTPTAHTFMHIPMTFPRTFPHMCPCTGIILRPHEQSDVSGTCYYLWGVSLCFLLPIETDASVMGVCA